jgi:hypothetical protein
MTRSGARAWACWAAATPPPASPATSMLLTIRRADVSARRNAEWSSTTSTRNLNRLLAGKTGGKARTASIRVNLAHRLRPS